MSRVSKEYFEVARRPRRDPTEKITVKKSKELDMPKQDDLEDGIGKEGMANMRL